MIDRSFVPNEWNLCECVCMCFFPRFSIKIPLWNDRNMFCSQTTADSMETIPFTNKFLFLRSILYLLFLIDLISFYCNFFWRFSYLTDVCDDITLQRKSCKRWFTTMFVLQNVYMQVVFDYNKNEMEARKLGFLLWLIRSFDFVSKILGNVRFEHFIGKQCGGEVV